MSGEGLLANGLSGPDDRDGPSPDQDPDVNDVRAQIWALIAFAVGTTRPLLPAKLLADSATNLGEMGCDQLDCLTIAMDLEECLSIAIPDDVITRDRTIGDLADTLLPHILEKMK